MSKTNSSAPIKPPTAGVLCHLDPQDVAENALVSAENFIYRRGEFRTRPGMTVHTSVDTALVNYLTEGQSNIESGIGCFSTAGFVTIAASTPVTTEQNFGPTALKMTFTGDGQVFISPIVDLPAYPALGQSFTASVYIYKKTLFDPPPGVSLSLILEECDSVGTVIARSTTVVPAFKASSSFIRVEVTHTFLTGVSALVSMKYETFPLLPTQIIIIDGLQLEIGAHAHTWVPGSGGDYDYSGKLADRPMGFRQYDVITATENTRNKLIAGTITSWYSYEEVSKMWRDITHRAHNGSVIFTGGVLDPMTVTGLNILNNDEELIITVSMTNPAPFPDRFDWVAVLSGLSGAGLDMLTTPVSLPGTGLSVQWGSENGHTVGDEWAFDAFTDMSLTGGRSNQVVFRTYDQDGETLVFGCNGKDRLFYFAPNADFYMPAESFTNVPSPKTIAVTADRLVCGNFWLNGQYYPNGIIYSATVMTGGARAAVPSAPGASTVWPVNNIVIIADTPGEIIANMEMGALQCVIYKATSIHALIAQTGLSPFRIERRAENISGPVSPLAVVPLDSGGHVYLARNGGVYLFDGSPPRLLGEHIQTWIRRTIDFTTSDEAWGYYDNVHQEVWFFYPDILSKKLTRGICIQITAEGYPMWPIVWRDDADETSAGIHAIIDTPTKIGQLTSPFEVYGTATLGSFVAQNTETLFGLATGQIYKFDDNSDDDGSSIVAHFETGLIKIGKRLQPARMMQEFVVTEIQHEFDPVSMPPGLSTAQAINVNLRLQENRKVLTPTRIIVPGTAKTPLTTSHRVKTRGAQMRMYTLATTKIVWRGSEIQYAIRGQR